MLKDDFYTILALDAQTETVNVTLQLNEAHAIYNGHFPGQPVVPGACLMQMVKEIAEVIIDSKLEMLKASELKFLLPVNPIDNNLLQGTIHYVIEDNNQINVVASFLQDNKLCFKSKITFKGK